MWLPAPPRGTSVCGGFDGSENDDHTVIKLETRAGFVFTPRWGPDQMPAIWKPKELPGKRVPRNEVRAAWASIVDFYDLRRAYCDPGFHDETSYETEIEEWALAWPLADGSPTRFVSWPTTSELRMYAAIRRFEADLRWITHDGCPTTEAHMRNARKIMNRTGRRYRLGKPSHHQKIDAAVTSVLAHEAAADERAAGWPDRELPPLVFGI